jgi:large subunit ribosomal protein L7/L12
MTDDKTQEVTEAVEEVKEAVEEVKEAVEEVKEVAEEVKEEVKEEPKEEVKEEVKAEEPKAEPSGKFKDLIKEIEGLSALELSELVKALEDRFGVSAAAPMAMMAGAPAAAADGGDDEKANYNIVLKDGGSNKIGAIKAVREVLPELGLVEAKTLIESAPKKVFQQKKQRLLKKS